MTAIEMLAELAKSWDVKIWHDVSDPENHPNAYRVELFPRLMDLVQRGEQNEYDCVARYADDNFEAAVKRAWAGEPPDG